MSTPPAEPRPGAVEHTGPDAVADTARLVAVVVPAKDEALRLAATIRACAQLPGVDVVVVVDDGSRDGTGQIAHDEGAVVVRHTRTKGKAAAMTSGAAYVARRDHHAGTGPHHLLFADADLEGSAAALRVLVDPLRAGEADVTIAVLPPQRTAGGGRGLVVGLARDGIAALTGWQATQPLSGMRALTREAFDAVQPFAPGWGVETAMTVDALRAGLRVVEVPCELHHRVTGRDLRSQAHRAAQYRDVARALLARGWRPTR